VARGDEWGKIVKEAKKAAAEATWERSWHFERIITIMKFILSGRFR
jgi:hypothetical protein